MQSSTSRFQHKLHPLSRRNSKKTWPMLSNGSYEPNQTCLKLPLNVRGFGEGPKNLLVVRLDANLLDGPLIAAGRAVPVFGFHAGINTVMSMKVPLPRTSQ